MKTENLKLKIVFLGTPYYVKPVKKVIEKNFKLVEKIVDSDLIVVASYGRILSKNDIETPKYGAINIHPSLLPKYRGPTPVQTSILNGDKKTGVTIIKLDEKVDHGPILAQKELEIKENETSESLLKRAFELGAEMLPKALLNYIEVPTNATSQDDLKATYTKTLTKKDGYIDLEKISKSLKIDRMVRAYYPWPGVWFKTNLSSKEQIIKLLPEQKIQVEGKKPMSYKDFINGYKEGEEILEKLSMLS